MLNKKFYLFFSILLFSGAFLFAGKIVHSSIGTGNDMWNFGLSENYDDQLSYSLQTNVSYDGFFFKSDIEGYTNRGNKDKQGNFTHGRFDKMDFIAGYYYRRPIGSMFLLEVQPEVGLSFLGMFGMEWAQNFIHRISKLNELTGLPQDFSSTKTLPVLNLSVSLGYDLMHFDNTKLLTKLVFDTYNIVDFRNRRDYKLGFSFLRNESDVETVYLFVGVAKSDDISEVSTERLFSKNINGFEFGFGLNSGVLSIDYTNYLKFGFGYTYVNFDIASFFKDKVFESEDFWFSYGKTILLNRDFGDNQLGLPIKNGFFLVFRNCYTSGYPILSDSEKDYNKVRYKRNYSFDSINVRYEYVFKPKGIITAYSQLGAGVSVWDYAYLYNMDPNADEMENNDHLHNLFFANCEMGFIAIPKNMIVFDNAQYQFVVYGGVNWLPKKDIVTKIVIRDHSHDSSFKFNGFAPYAGFGVRVGIDI